MSAFPTPGAALPPNPPFIVRLAVTAVTAFVTSSVMSFVGLALNYGWHDDFLVRWLKVFAFGYILVLPTLLVILPPIQRSVVGYFMRRR